MSLGVPPTLAVPLPLSRQRREDVREARARVSEEQLRAMIASFDTAHGAPLDLFQRIRDDDRAMTLAAEFKRASPSKGALPRGVVPPVCGVIISSMSVGRR
jgi:indole-3-glycerol phosphate synthase